MVKRKRIEIGGPLRELSGRGEPHDVPGGNHHRMGRLWRRRRLEVVVLCWFGDGREDELFGLDQLVEHGVLPLVEENVVTLVHPLRFTLRFFCSERCSDMYTVPPSTLA